MRSDAVKTGLAAGTSQSHCLMLLGLTEEEMATSSGRYCKFL